jgi:hypothetical protein
VVAGGLGSGNEDQPQALDLATPDDGSSGAAGSNGKEYFALDDGKGSVVVWLDGTSNEVVGRAEYTPEVQGRSVDAPGATTGDELDVRPVWPTGRCAPTSHRQAMRRPARGRYSMVDAVTVIGVSSCAEICG